jgi:hypothetical protein
MSKQEQVSWVSLIVTLLLAIWYFGRVLALPPDVDLMSGEMARFITRLIGFAIAMQIGFVIMLRIAQQTARAVTGAPKEGDDATPIDERDRLIELYAARNAHFVLCAGAIAVFVQIGLTEWVQRRAHHEPPQPDNLFELLLTGPLSALHVAQLLLLVLTLTSLTGYITRIVHYRRGY